MTDSLVDHQCDLVVEAGEERFVMDPYLHRGYIVDVGDEGEDVLTGDLVEEVGRELVLLGCLVQGYNEESLFSQQLYLAALPPLKNSPCLYFRPKLDILHQLLIHRVQIVMYLLVNVLIRIP